KVRVQVRPDWVEPVNLYTVCALSVGERKSPIFREALAPVVEYEKELKKLSAPTVADALCELRQLEARQKHVESRAAKEADADARAQLKEEARELARQAAAFEVPAEPVCFIDDDTNESIGKTLAEQGGRLLVAAPEGTVLEIVKG